MPPFASTVLAADVFWNRAVRAKSRAAGLSVVRVEGVEPSSHAWEARIIAVILHPRHSLTPVKIKRLPLGCNSLLPQQPILKLTKSAKSERGRGATVSRRPFWASGWKLIPISPIVQILTRRRRGAKISRGALPFEVVAPFASSRLCVNKAYFTQAVGIRMQSETPCEATGTSAVFGPCRALRLRQLQANGYHFLSATFHFARFAAWAAKRAAVESRISIFTILSPLVMVLTTSIPLVTSPKTLWRPSK